MHQLIRKILLGLFTIIGLQACDQPQEDALVVGTISGPETELVEVAKTEAFKQHGLRIKIIEFSDYNLPNEALRDGALDANVYQHLPYLQAAIKARSYPFSVIGKTYIYPVGLYSKKHARLEDIPEKARIALPNDPSNEARALKLLEQRGFIKLKTTDFPDVKDIIKNPKHWTFVVMDAAQLPRILPDVDGAIINTTFAIPSGLNPQKDALLLEDKNSPYANLIVIRNDNPKKEQLDQLVEALHSQAVQDKAQEVFQGGALPAW